MKKKLLVIGMTVIMLLVVTVCILRLHSWPFQKVSRLERESRITYAAIWDRFQNTHAQQIDTPRAMELLTSYRYTFCRWSSGYSGPAIQMFVQDPEGALTEWIVLENDQLIVNPVGSADQKSPCYQADGALYETLLALLAE